MGTIHQIQCSLIVGDNSKSGSGGRLFLGVCGREFRLQIHEFNLFQRDQAVLFNIGVGANVEEEGMNDPRSPALRTEDLGKFPIYVRFEPPSANAGDHLELTQVYARAREGTKLREHSRYSALVGNDDSIWLGNHCGKYVYLRKTLRLWGQNVKPSAQITRT